MSHTMYRTIVGEASEPLFRDSEVPQPYRQTHPAPLAQKVQGSAPSEPREAEQPITEDPEPDQPL